MIRTSQASVTGTRSLILQPGPEASIADPVPLLLTNRGTASVFVGDSAVTTADGYEVKPQESLGLSLQLGELLYAITAGTTERLDILKGRQL